MGVLLMTKADTTVILVSSENKELRMRSQDTAKFGSKRSIFERGFSFE